MIVFGNEHFGRVIAEAAGTTFNPEVDRCIARVERQELWGGVVFQNYTGASIGIHVAAFRDDWINKDMLWVTFHYPFVQLGCKKIFGLVPVSNRKALEFDLKLGFKIEATITDVFDDGDCAVVSMRKDECRWLRVRPTGLKELTGGGVWSQHQPGTSGHA